MLYYYECQKCKNVTDLYLESELPKDTPTCNACAKAGCSLVVKQQTLAFFFGCVQCKGQWVFFDTSAYSTQKQSRPNCPTCKTNSTVFFVPPNMSTQKVEKRQTPGLLNPDEHDLSGFPSIKPEIALQGFDRLKKEEFREKAASKKLHPVKDPSANRRIQSELAYKTIKKRRLDYDKKYGVLKDEDDPLKTTVHKGTVVKFSTYETELPHSVKIKGTKYPRLSNSAPTVVNSVKIIERSKTWDYRLTGPNSFLRRLCSLLYTLDYGNSFNPIELQAMWAAGSLYISSNNYSYMQKLHKSLTDDDKDLKTLVGNLKLGQNDTGTHLTKYRNFRKAHQSRLRNYKTSIEKNTQTDYKSYFLYQWEYIFNKMRDSLTWKTCQTLIVSKNNGDYTKWTVPVGLTAGKVYLVMPEQGQGFIKKEVHAEQLFYPILVVLNNQGKLSAPRPAFIGGVKTPCRTCHEVLKAAANLLKEKLILPTNAFGHYWKASAQHVPNVTFKPSDETLVFGDPNLEKVFDTEMPMSPPHE